MNRRVLAAGVALTAGLGLGLTGSGASATPATPAPGNPAPSGSVIGTLDGPATTKKDGISLKVSPDTDVRSFTLTYPIKATSGWHQHPGIVLAVVEQGTVKREIGCHYQKFSVGDSFTESATHQVTNVGPDVAILRITQLYPAGVPVAELREDRPAPKCPTNKGS